MKKSELIDYIRSTTTERRLDGQYYQPFCFKIKIGSIDLDLDTLIGKGEVSEDEVASFRESYNAIGEDLFWTACRNVIEDFFTGDFTTKSGKPIKNVFFGTGGRSGGWLYLEDMEGWEFRNWDREKVLAALSYRDLQKLATLVEYADKHVSQRLKLVTDEAIWLCREEVTA